MSLTPPQSPLQWDHAAPDITRLTQEAIDADRALLDKVAALDPKDCTFESVSYPYVLDLHILTFVY